MSSSLSPPPRYGADHKSRATAVVGDPVAERVTRDARQLAEGTAGVQQPKKLEVSDHIKQRLKSLL